MADTIGTAYVQIEPSFDGVVPKIDKEFGGAGQKSGKSFGQGFAKVAGGIGKATAVAFTAVTTEAIGLGKALFDNVSQTAQFGDNIDKMSQKMGLTASAYQEWDAVMQHSGTSMETMKASMKTLANAAETGSEAFQLLGLSQEEVANMSQQDLFEATIAGLQNVEDTTQRTYIAGKLLGRGATELGALLNTSAEDTQAMRDRIHELGGVMSDEAVKASAAFQDQLQDMQTSFTGLTNKLSAEFLPSITNVMGGLTEIFAGNYDQGLTQISAGIDTIVGNFNDMLPKLAEVGLGIIESLAKAIIDNLPKIIETATDILMRLSEGIIGALPQLVDTALQIIITLSDGLIKALPEMIPQIVGIVIQIVDTLLNNIDMLIDVAIQLIMALVDGVVAATPILIEKFPEIILKIWEAIIRNLPKILQAAVELIMTLIKGIANNYAKVFEVGKQMIDKIKEGFMQKIENAKTWGKDMIQKFIDGILAKWNDLKSSVANVAQSVKDLIGFSEPEEGPLSNFHTYAPDMMDLFSKGIKDNSYKVTDALAGVGADMMDTNVNVNHMVSSDFATRDNDNTVSIGGVVASAVKDALIGMGIYMDSQQVGEMVAQPVNNALGRIATRGIAR